MKGLDSLEHFTDFFWCLKINYGCAFINCALQESNYEKFILAFFHGSVCLNTAAGTFVGVFADFQKQNTMNEDYRILKWNVSTSKPQKTLCPDSLEASSMLEAQDREGSNPQFQLQ